MLYDCSGAAGNLFPSIEIGTVGDVQGTPPKGRATPVHKKPADLYTTPASVRAAVNIPNPANVSS